MYVLSIVPTVQSINNMEAKCPNREANQQPIQSLSWWRWTRPTEVFVIAWLDLRGWLCVWSVGGEGSQISLLSHAGLSQTFKVPAFS